MELLIFGAIAIGVQVACKGIEAQKDRKIESIKEDIEKISQNITYFYKVKDRESVRQNQQVLKKKQALLRQLES